MTKPQLCFYARTSGKTQEKEGTIQRQCEEFRKAEQHLSQTYEIVYRFPDQQLVDDEARYFLDDGYNLESWDELSALADIWKRCKAGEIDAIYLVNTDRLFRSRSAELRGKLTDFFNEYEVSILTPSGLANPSRLITEITSAIGAEDKRATLVKCHEAKIMWAKREGRPPTGRSDFGYHWDKYEHKWSIVEDEAIIIKAATSMIIGEVIDESLPATVKITVEKNPFGLPDKVVADVLNSIGFSKASFFKRINLRRHGRSDRPQFDISSVSNIFRDDRYRGFVKFDFTKSEYITKAKTKRSAEVVTYPRPRILSDEHWEAVRRKRSIRQRTGLQYHTKYEYLCAGVMVCAECGRKMTSRAKHNKRHYKTKQLVPLRQPLFYYACTRRKKVFEEVCEARPYYQAPIADDLVWNEVKKFLIDPSRLKKIEASKYQHQPDDIAALRSQSEMFKVEIQKLEHELGQARSFLLKGIFSEEEFVEQKIKTEVDLNKQKIYLKSVETQINKILDFEENQKKVDLNSLSLKYSAKIEELGYEERKLIIRLIIKSVLVSKAGGMILNFVNTDTQVEV